MPESTQFANLKADHAAEQSVLITGANAGLGFFAARELVALGYRVILACRNVSKAHAAIRELRAEYPAAQVEFVELDLADFSSISKAVRHLERYPVLDAVLLNAGRIGSADPKTTKSGFELQIGTNYLGHLQLIQLLLPKLEKQPEARIIQLGSISHRWVRIPKNGALIPKKYWSPKNYALSKLYCMTLAIELQRRLSAKNSPVKSLIAHPGFSWDQYNSHQPKHLGPKQFSKPIFWAMRLIAQGKDAGAKALVAAVTAKNIRGGEYFGPTGFFQLKGKPGLVKAKAKVYNKQNGQLLWLESLALLKQSK